MSKLAPKFFPERNTPRIYAYSDTNFKKSLKIGFTERAVQARMDEHYPTNLPHQPYKVLLDEIAMREDGSFFKDHDVHKVLKRKKIKRNNGEWFECTLADVKAAILEVKTG